MNESKKGRPHKSKEESKNYRVQLRLTNEEYELLESLSKKSGLTKTMVILESLKQFAESQK